MNYWLDCWKKYAVFSGRARRREFWIFSLFNFLIGFAIGFVARLAGVLDAGIIISNICSLAALLPGLAVTSRRLHDTGRSAWWMLIALVPVVGPIVFLVFMCLDSQPGGNAYGPNPKG